jgi:ketosteroid isomerase-like protein
MTDEAKTVARGFLEALWSGDKATAKSLFADDAVWWFPPSLGYPRPSPAARAVDIVMDDMIGRFDLAQPFTVELHHLISEAGEVAAEYTATATTVTGRNYDHRYLLRFSVASGKITTVRAWADTKYFVETLYGD